MRSLFAAVAVVASSASLFIPSFNEFEALYDRHYEPTERDYRMTVYYDNVLRILQHNDGDESWTMDVNQFADLTADEFHELYVGGGYVARGSRSARPLFVMPPHMALPASVDWTEHGAVTPVKNQGQCGSCWSFSATGAMEGAWFLKNGSLVSLSEQQLVDCSVSEGNEGCNGGLMDYAFQYVVDNHGITTEAAYPYTATGPNTCKATGKPVAARMTSYVDVTANSDNDLMAAIVQQPVSVAVEADQSSFQFYSGGVLTASCGTNLDHGVLAVGYGTLNGQEYYKVKNSWGVDWGMSGYILLGRGASYNGGSGQCGILMDPSYPVV